MKDKVAQADIPLKRCSLARVGRLTSLWQSVEWKAQEHQLVAAPVELARNGAHINLYPSLKCLGSEQTNHAIIKAFGQWLYYRMSPQAKKRWEQKLVYPTQSQVQAFQDRLAARKFSNFMALVVSFVAASDRLVALNLANAFIINRQPIVDCQGVDVFKWGYTEKYASTQVPHSILSIASAYCSKPVLDDFGDCFAEFVLKDGRSIKESSVSAAMRGLVEDLITLVR